MGFDVWDKILRVDLGGNLPQPARRPRGIMGKAGRGSIVNVSSLSGHSPRLGQAAYCAAKAGVISLTKVLALGARRFEGPCQRRVSGDRDHAVQQRSAEA